VPSRADIIKANDELRTQFKGGIVLMTPAVWDLEPRLRARALYRMTLYQAFDDESDHSEGVFIFAGYTFVWRIEEFAGERSLTLLMDSDLLI
jgi:hypothetical protein